MPVKKTKRNSKPAAKQGEKKAKVISPVIVGIGASAGGLEALTRLFSSLPCEQDFAFVVIQHLDPNRESHLTDILSRTSTMPVETIENGMTVHPRKVYVLPPNSLLTARQGVFHLETLPARKGRPTTIDHFFESLAGEKKSDAIGVILSGTGSDGAQGLAAIQSHKGVTFVQDPETAKFDGMPQSAIQAGAADFVLTPEAIAEEIVEISKRLRSGEELQDSKPKIQLEKVSPDSNEALRRIYFLLRSHAHIDFTTYKSSTVLRRIQRQIGIHKQSSLDNYAKLLQVRPDAVRELFEEIFIHVTAFFRDPESFEALKLLVFPALKKKRKNGAPLRIWVPGCSTGEEAYSLTISLLEFLEQEDAHVPLQVFATDISEKAIHKARSGVYTAHEVRSVSPALLKKYFDFEEGQYRVKKTVRELCIFSRHDLANSPPFAKIDLVSCRNVLIYFTQNLQKRVFPIFHYSLNPDGFLWLGKSEAPMGFSHLFAAVDATHKIYSKIDVATPLNFRFTNQAPIPETTGSKRPAGKHLPAPVDTQREFDRILMAKYAPSGVMVNQDMEILQVRGQTAPYMQLPPGQPTHNLLKMIRPELLPSLRVTLQSAIKKNLPARRENISYEFGSEQRHVSIEVIPVNPLAKPKDRQFLIVFEEQTSSATNIRMVAKKPKAQRQQKNKKLSSKDSYVQQILEELDSMREYQQSLIEGYETSQQELSASVEELQSTNEELQSTNEELETAKEELQAANEEMATLNEELQNQNAELISLNERLTISEERFRRLVSGVKDYAIFMLDPEGRVATWNEGAKNFKGYEADEIIGKHFSIFYPPEVTATGFPQKELKIAAEEGRFEDEGWRVRKDGSRFWANVVLTRIRDKSGNLIGFTKITRDLTERKRLEDELRKSHNELEIRVKERTQELENIKAELESDREKLRYALGARDEFISIASHELKTPLTSLKLQFQIALRDLEKNPSRPPTQEDLLESYQFAIRQVDSLSGLVEDLLDISRIQTGNLNLAPEQINLSEVIRDVTKRFDQQLASVQSDVRLDLQPSINGTWDRRRMEQVLANLISNAIKYAPKSLVEIQAHQDKQKTVLKVTDHGPGISKAMQTKIFDRFERAGASKNAGGLGLGLFIVRMIVEGHKGSVRVESELGKGAQFIIELPNHPDI